MFRVYLVIIIDGGFDDEDILYMMMSVKCILTSQYVRFVSGTNAGLSSVHGCPGTDEGLRIQLVDAYHCGSYDGAINGQVYGI